MDVVKQVELAAYIESPLKGQLASFGLRGKDSWLSERGVICFAGS